MKLLTNEQYKEYQDLKHWAAREKVLVSAKSITSLEDDIDLPIKKCVGGLALLGFTPIFSCCGFDYDGQPYHKYHQYDRPYIILANDERIPHLLPNNSWRGWEVSPHVNNTFRLEFITSMNPSWRTRDCIHSVEECVLGLANLEGAILYAVANTQTPEYVTIKDSNKNYTKSGIRFWQYPPKDDWVVSREWLLTP